MKQKKYKYRRSFLLTCMAQFAFYSLIVALILVLLGYLISRRITSLMPIMEDVLSYEEQLSRDEFEKIPLQRFPGCDILVLDEHENTLYTTSAELAQEFDRKELQFIDDYYNDSYYNVFCYTGQESEGEKLIVRQYFNEESQLIEVDSYCLLDKDGTILYGDLFEDKGSLSQKEVDLLNGIYHNKKNIQRYSYETEQGRARTLLFFSPPFDFGKYNEKADAAERMWLLAVPFVLALIMIQTFLFLRKIRHSIEPLNKAIVEYGKGNRIDLEKAELPQEFHGVVDNFEHLLNQLEQSRQETEQAYQDRQRVLADLSHDIRTPLTVIQGYTKALNDGVVPPDRQRQYIQVIYDRAESVAELTETLQEYTQMEHPDYQLEMEPLNLCEYCRRYLVEKYAEFQLKQFILNVDIPEKPLYIMADRLLLKRIFENLISNATRNNPAGTTITFRLEPQENTVRILLADDGVGIPESLRGHIFKPFVSGNRARTAGRGTGLGLSIAKRVAELHHGSIALVWPPSEGFSTEFEVILPRIDQRL